MTRVLAVSLALFLLNSQSVAQDGAAASTPSQDSPTQSSQALAVLKQALQTAGGANLQGAPGFSASGSITYYWAGEEVKGSALISGKGADEFSLQVSLPKSNRSLAVSHGQGAVQEIDGTTTTIPYYNAVNQAAATLPLMRVLAAVSNPSTDVSYQGLVEVEGRPAHDIRLVAPPTRFRTPKAASKTCELWKFSSIQPLCSSSRHRTRSTPTAT